MMTERTTWKTGLSLLLAFQVLVAGSLALFALLDFPGLLKQFGVQHQSDMGILQLIMAYNLVLSASLCLWSILWIRNGSRSGMQAGTTIGALIFVVSMAVFLRFDRVDVLMFDSIRALAMVVLGVLALREHERHHRPRS